MGCELFGLMRSILLRGCGVVFEGMSTASDLGVDWDSLLTFFVGGIFAI
jgi:hypothetical protein